MAILASLLFSFMAQSVKAEKKMERARSAILERQNLQIRLQDLFSSVLLDPGEPPFYTKPFPKEKQQNLIVHFDNGIDPDPQFCGSVMGRIYLDENGDLALVYWPKGDEKKRSWRKETLLSRVNDFSFQFLASHEMVGNQALKASPIVWDSAWSKEKRKVPSMIRLTLKQKESTLRYAFRLPFAQAIPTWRDP